LGLNDRELLVIATKAMRFSEKESLEYLKAHNHAMGEASYYRILAHVKSETMKRLYEIAKSMKDHHLERIDELALIKKELWRTYHQSTLNADKIRALKVIGELQPWISAYDEATQSILENAVKQFKKEEEAQTTEEQTSKD